MLRRPQIALLALATALALALALVVILRGSSGRSPSVSEASGGSRFEGAALPAGMPAPEFTLTDQLGRPVSLADYRGQVTVLTFLYSGCGATCVLIAQQIRGAIDELHGTPAVLVVSADPTADTPARVQSFLAQVSLTGRVRYLTGSPARLRAIWRAYRIAPASDGAASFQRTASVLLVDRRGRERVLFGLEQLTPESLAHDIRRLDGEPGHP
ncbi:MAG: electron transport protein SCO1/SenC [Solirubrobacterales bacterium]|nr:electron transport protein SCO1/SenC [Solirubrobacterales bacterium]